MRTEIAIVGTGPYGLSIGAHLRKAGVQFRIVGRVMETWREQMPEGMLLKSDGFASNLSDPRGEFKLRDYCVENKLPYHATSLPVKLSVFTAYGEEFQRRMVPEVEEAKLEQLERSADEFLLRLDTGETFAAQKVILAVGISHYAYVPPSLSGLAPGVLGHSSQVPRPEVYRGSEIAVVGSGASAIDLAALSHEAGAKVTIVSRRDALKFHTKSEMETRSLYERLRRPSSGLGPGWKSRLVTEFPHWYRFLPVDMRLEVLRRLLGPAAGWPMRERVDGKVQVIHNVSPRSAHMRGNRAVLDLGREDGGMEQLEIDHVIAATGYRVDLRRLPFLSKEMQMQIRAVENMPDLSGNFESSVPGLYFVGISSAFTFGPMMRFAFGATYTAKRLARYLARHAERRVGYKEQVTVTT
jgi:thioredoxin reductase